MINFDYLRRFCNYHEADLVIAPPLHPFTLCLRGEFDGYEDFFSLLFRDVEYIDVARGFPVGDLVMADFRTISLLTPKWSKLGDLYSGPAVAFRSDDTQAWNDSEHVFLVVANLIRCEPGRDWPSELAPQSPGG